MRITLGNETDQLEVVLTRDSDFVSTLTNKDGNWSPTCTIEIRIGSGDDQIVWPANIVDDIAAFDVDKAAVNILHDATVKLARLFYIDGTADLCWATGEVDRR